MRVCAKRCACVQKTLCCAKDLLSIVVLVVVVVVVVVVVTAATIPPKLQHRTTVLYGQTLHCTHMRKYKATASSTLINKRSGKSGIRSVLFSFRYRCFNSSHVKCFSFVKLNRQKTNSNNTNLT